jgi:hypothetical protein
MGTWNYRIVKHREQLAGEVETAWYGLHEVYYADDGEMLSRTEYPVLGRDTPEELIDGLEMMLRAAKKNLDTQDIIDDEATEWPGL